MECGLELMGVEKAWAGGLELVKRSLIGILSNAEDNLME